MAIPLGLRLSSMLSSLAREVHTETPQWGLGFRANFNDAIRNTKRFKRDVAKIHIRAMNRALDRAHSRILTSLANETGAKRSELSRSAGRHGQVQKHKAKGRRKDVVLYVGLDKGVVPQRATHHSRLKTHAPPRPNSKPRRINGKWFQAVTTPGRPPQMMYVFIDPSTAERIVSGVLRYQMTRFYPGEVRRLAMRIR